MDNQPRTTNEMPTAEKWLLRGGLLVATMAGGVMLSEGIANAAPNNGDTSSDTTAQADATAVDTDPQTTNPDAPKPDTTNPDKPNPKQPKTPQRLDGIVALTAVTDKINSVPPVSADTIAPIPTESPTPDAATNTKKDHTKHQNNNDAAAVATPDISAGADQTPKLVVENIPLARADNTNTQNISSETSNFQPTLAISTTTPEAPNLTPKLDVNGEGLLIDSLAQPAAPPATGIIDKLNGLADTAAMKIVEVATGEPVQKQDSKKRDQSVQPASSAFSASPSATQIQPNVLIFGAGTEVTVDADGTIHANSTDSSNSTLPDVASSAPNGSDEIPTDPNTTQNSPEPIPPVAANNTAPTLPTPEIHGDKVDFGSTIAISENNTVDLSNVTSAIDLVNETPLPSSDFPNPEGYRKIPRGDTWSDFNYVFNKGEDGSIPTCENEQFDSANTIAIALLMAKTQQAVARANGQTDFVPMFMDATSTHAAEHYDGGDIDIHSIYVDGKYSHELNLAWLQQIVLLRHPDGSPLIHHIQTSDVALANALNQLIDDAYGPGSRPNVNVQADHTNHFHVSTDGGGSDKSDQALPHAGPKNVQNCLPFDGGFSPASMTYSDAFRKIALGLASNPTAYVSKSLNLAGAPSTNSNGSRSNLMSTQNPVSGSGGSPLLSSFASAQAQPSAPTEITAYSVSDVINAPVLKGGETSVGAILTERLGHLARAGRLNQLANSVNQIAPIDIVQAPATQPAVTNPNTPSSTADGNVSNGSEAMIGSVATNTLAEVHPTFKYMSLLSDTAKNYTCSQDDADTKSPKSKQNGGNLSYEEAYGPAFPGSDVYLMFLNSFEKKRPGDPTNAAQAKMFTARAFRESSFRPCSVGDIKPDKNGITARSYGFDQIRTGRGSEDPNSIRNAQRNLDPILAADDTADIYMVSGDAPWGTPAGLSAKALKAASDAEAQANVLLQQMAVA